MVGRIVQLTPELYHKLVEWLLTCDIVKQLKYFGLILNNARLAWTLLGYINYTSILLERLKYRLYNRERGKLEAFTDFTETQPYNNWPNISKSTGQPEC